MALREAGRHSITLRIAWLICVVAVIVGSLLPADSAPMRALDKLAINDRSSTCWPMPSSPSVPQFMSAAATWFFADHGARHGHPLGIWPTVLNGLFAPLRDPRPRRSAPCEYCSENRRGRDLPRP